MPNPETKRNQQFRVRSDVHGGFIITTTLATVAAVRYAIWRFTKDVESAVVQAVDDVTDLTNQN